MDRYAVLADNARNNATLVNPESGYAFNIRGFGMLYRDINNDTVSLAVFVRGFKRPFFVLRGSTLAECLERSAKFIQKRHLTSAGTIEVCHRCFGNTSAFMQYNINDGRCFVCNSRGYNLNSCTGDI